MPRHRHDARHRAAWRGSDPRDTAGAVAGLAQPGRADLHLVGLLRHDVLYFGRLRWPAAPAITAVGLILLVAVTMRALVPAVVWHAAGLVFLDCRHQTVNLPSGSMMLMAYGTKLSTLRWRQIWSRPIMSIATQVVFRYLFVPSIFANPAEQPIGLRAAYRRLNQPTNLSAAAHRRPAIQALASLWARDRSPISSLTVLYRGDVAIHHAGLVLLHALPHFLVLDRCGDSR